MSNETLQPESSVFDQKVSRRGFLKGALGLGATIGLSTLPDFRPQSAAAEVPKENKNISPLKLITPEGQEYDFERRISPTIVTFDSELKNRAITPIDAITLSEDSALFQDLTPNNPQDRLDLFSLWMLTGMYKYRRDFADLQKEPYQSQDEMTSTPTGQRALAGIIPEVTLEDMMEYNDKLADPEFKDFGTWAYDEGEVSGLNFKRKKIRTDGVSINFTNTPSAFTWLYDTVSAGTPPMKGVTQTVNEEGFLTLDIYVKDQAFNSNVQTPAEFFDSSFSTGISKAGEYMVLYGGRYDLFQGFDASIYKPLRNQDNGFYLYSTPAELTGGPLDPEYKRYISAPIVEVESPKIPR